MENCHGCTRIVWNANVLNEEAQHRGRHERGECHCEVIFDTEERERRRRPRGGKDKEKDKDLTPRTGLMSHSVAQHADVVAGLIMPYQPPLNAARSLPKGLRNHGHGYGNSGAAGNNRPDVSSFNAQSNPYPFDEPIDQEAKLSAWRYLGYDAGKGNSHVDIAHVEAGYGFPEGGFIPQNMLWEGQLSIGQYGAGMKFYPPDIENQSLESQAFHPLPPLQPAAGPGHVSSQRLPQVPVIPVASPDFPIFLDNIDKIPRNWQKARQAMSEPGDVSNYTSSVADTAGGITREVAQTPTIASAEVADSISSDATLSPKSLAIVSGDMVRTADVTAVTSV